jgi:CRISPR-associated protein Csm1
VDDLEDEHTRALARLVSRADSLASRERAERAAQFQDFRTTALVPVFHRVRLLKSETPAEMHLPHAEIQDLSEEPPIFPQAGRDVPIGRVTAHIRSFGSAFVRLHEKLEWEDFECVYAHFLSLLHRFTACIASDTQSDPPDISLYDHLRVTSAIAACLYRYHQGTGTLTDELIRDPPDKRCALVVGDFSGIQDYLFDIATVGAGGVARRLRARSFFLQMLAEVAALKVLRAFELPLANVLMSSGGKFYVLVPHWNETASVISRLQTECDAWLLENFHGELALNLAWTPIAEEEFGTGAQGAGFSAALERLHAALAQRKRRRLERVLIEDGSWQEERFLQDPFPADASACLSCRRHPAERKSDPQGEVDICRQCDQDVQLGRKLPTARFIGFYPQTVEGSVPCFDGSFVLAESVDELPASPWLVVRVNNADLTPAARLPATFRFLTNHVPHEPDGTLWTFEEIASRRKLDEGEASSGLLAVIKADVDYLGQIFREGLRRDEPPGYDTPSRIASLSRQLDLFFTAWLEWLLREEFPNVYAVYSGGDDLLLVAPRAEALALVKRIYNDFARYTDNPELTLSAGVALVKPRLPLAHTVRLADAALEAAKGSGRNRLGLLNHVVPWSDLPLIEAAIRVLERSDPPPTSAFLFQLIRFAELWQEWKTTRNPLALRFHPLLAYTLSRTVKPDSELFHWTSRLIGFPLEDDRCEEARIMDHLGLIARWVLLGRRESRDATTV